MNANTNKNTATTTTKDTSSIDEMLRKAAAFQEQAAEFAAETAALRADFQRQIQEIDAEKGPIDAAYKAEIENILAMKTEAETAYKERVSGLLARRNELAAKLQQLVSAGLGKPAAAATVAASVPGDKQRNSGVKDWAFELLRANPKMSAQELADAAAIHYGNDRSGVGTMNQVKVLFKKLHPEMY